MRTGFEMLFCKHNVILPFLSVYNDLDKIDCAPFAHIHVIR